jgi:hypothetical protein
VDREQRGEADEQGRGPARAGTAEGNRSRDHRDHPAEEAEHERDRDGIAEDPALVVVLNRTGHRRLLGRRQPVRVVDQDRGADADRHLVGGVEDEEEDKRDAAQDGGATLDPPQEQVRRDPHQRGEEQEGRVHEQPGVDVVAHVPVDLLAAGGMPPEGDGERQWSEDQKQSAEEGRGQGLLLP